MAKKTTEKHEGLTLCRGGRLIESRWSAKAQKCATRDVTRLASTKLFEHCTLAPDVTLRDVFRLINTDVSFYITLGSYWAREYVQEALYSDSGKRYTGKYDPEGIEYLELSKLMMVDRGRKWTPSATVRVDFGGVGFRLRAAQKDGMKKGARTPWGLSFSPASDLVNIPLRLKPDLVVYDQFPTPEQRKAGDGKLATYENATFTLGEILHGVIWELSWFGPPTARDEAAAELKKRSDDVQSGKAKTDVGFTLGEILHGVMWELSWHGAPAERDGFAGELKKRSDDVQSGKAKTVPWSEVKKKLGARKKKRKARR